MLKHFKSLFSKKKINRDNAVSADFDQNVRRAISFFENRDDLNTDEDIVECLTKNGIGNQEAIDILLFLPVAFVRQWLPTVKWLDTYIEYIDHKTQMEKKYSERESYQIIYREVIAYFNDKPDKNTILKIGGRSAEFDAINNFLNDQPDAILEEMEFLPTVIIR